MNLVRVPVRDIQQAQVMREIRNACREGFSGFTGIISADEQVRWWTENRYRVRAWLYCRAGAAVGFGMLRQTEDGRWWTVTAVLPAFGGRGYGKAITHDLVEEAGGDVWAMARKDNPAAVKLHPPEDWDVIGGPDERLMYFRGKPRFPREALEEWAEHGRAIT